MSEKSAWERVLNQISSPWDWAAAALGAAGGLGATILLHGTDLGTSIAAGATGGVAVSKAASASFQGRQLKRRASGLDKQIEESLKEIKDLPLKSPSSSATPLIEDRLSRLRIRLKQELRLWNNKATSNEGFANQIDKLI